MTTQQLTAPMTSAAVVSRVGGTATPIFVSLLAGLIAPLASASVIGYHQPELLYLLALVVPVILLQTSVNTALRVSAVAFAARASGDGELGVFRRRLTAVLLVGLAVNGALVLLLLAGSDAFMALYSVPEDRRALAFGFTQATLLVGTASMASMVLVSAVGGFGPLRASTTVTVTGLAAAVGLTAVLVPRLGLFALPVASGISTIGMIWWAARRLTALGASPTVRGMKRALVESARDITRISLPVCAGFVVAFGHSLGFTHIVALFSPTDVAGYGIAYRIQNVVLMPAIALGVGLAININRMTAAREPAPLTRFLPITVLLTTGLFGGVGALLFVGRGVVAQLSTGDAATATATAEYLTYAAPAYPIVGAALMLSIFLEETGNGARALAFNAVLSVSQLALAWNLANAYHSLQLTYLAVALSSLAAVPFLAHELQRSRRLGGRISAINEPTNEPREHEDHTARRPAADRRPRARKAGAHRRVRRGYVPRHRRTQ